MFATQRPLTFEELTAVLAPIGVPTEVSDLGGGTFSAVQLVTLTDGRRLAVKGSVPDSGDRPPLMTYERDMLRVERDMLLALAGDPGVPVPTLVLDDFTRRHVELDVIATDLIGSSTTPAVAWDTVRATMSGEANTRAGRSVGQIFAALHRRKGDTFGYPAGDFALGGATWPEAFGAMLTSVLDDSVAWGVDIRADAVRKVLDRGAAALAEVEEPTLVHMDLWAGNVLLDPATGNVRGIVDWERALYADPLAEFVGSESVHFGPSSPDLLAGYLAGGGELPLAPEAGTMSGFSPAADARTVLYRLYTVSIQQVEVVPRNFTGDWVADHLATLRRTRDQLLDYALA